MTSQKALSVTRTVRISGDAAVLMGNVETRGEQKSEVNPNDSRIPEAWRGPASHRYPRLENSILIGLCWLFTSRAANSRGWRAIPAGFGG
jgi:hypothetical protein